uniref:Uncharacterized protein n=1 Tax=Panagrolaimus superbus TaxID=310955 RepID=A0A914YV19_9BILA
MIALKYANILLLLICWCSSTVAFTETVEENVYYVCGEEIQEPDCICENEIMTCQEEANYGKNFKSANVVIIKPNFVAKNVTFVRSEITALKINQILPGRESTVEKLVISARSLRIIENGVFDNFTSLKSLSLIGTYLNNITDAVFTKKLGSTLTELDLSFNEFKLLSSINFTHLTNLKTLNLYGSKFGKNVSTSNLFPQALANLETLNLGISGFEVLNGSIFVNLVNLKTLYLAGNPLTSMPTAINYIPSLQNLYLDETLITVLNNTGIKINKNLEKIVMTNTNLVSIQDCAFCSFPNLKYLNFWDNQKLTFIDENAFGYAKNGSLPKIESISLEHGNLQIIPEKLLDWKNVREIGIGGNNFMCNCSLAWLVNNIDDLNLVQIYGHPLGMRPVGEGYRGHRAYYYLARSRENNLECHGPMALEKIHFSLIAGNLCTNHTHQNEHHHQPVAPHHIVCYFLCGIIVFAIIFAAISNPLSQLYAKLRNPKTTNPLSYENSNFDADSEVVNNTENRFP